MMMDDQQGVGIIGASCRFPGGVNSTLELWDNLLRQGKHAFQEVPPVRWKPASETVEAAEEDDGEYKQKAAADLRVQAAILEFLEMRMIDPEYFNYDDGEIASMDPQDRLALEIAAQIFHEAGLNKEALKGQKVGVFVAKNNHDWIDMNKSNVGTSSTPASHAAERISRAFDLRGPCFVVSSGCASSLVAMQMAVDSIQMKRCTLALVIGVHVLLTPRTYMHWESLKVLSESDQGTMLGPKSDGFVLGEGCGGVLLESIPHAERQGHKILAKVAAAVSGYTGDPMSVEPKGTQEKMRQLVEEARIAAGIEAQSNQIAYAELSCVGRRENDLLEACTLADEYGMPLQDPMIVVSDNNEGSADIPQRLMVGCIKSTVGHLEAASGIAGLVKALLVIQNREAPPQATLPKGPNQELGQRGIIVPMKSCIRLPSLHNQPLRVAINAMSWCGTNAHVILEEYIRHDVDECLTLSEPLAPLKYKPGTYIWWSNPFPPHPEDLVASDEESSSDEEDDDDTSEATRKPKIKRSRSDIARAKVNEQIKRKEEIAKLVDDCMKHINKRTRREHDLPPFMDAVKAKDLEAVQIWIEKGYEPMGGGILEAVRTGDTNLVKLIMEKGNVNERALCKIPDDADKRGIGNFDSLRGAGILHIAVLNNDPAMIETIAPYLKKAYEIVNPRTPWNAGAVCKDACKFTPLHYAVRNNKWKCIEALVKHAGHRFDNNDSMGNPPILWTQPDGKECLQDLIKFGADLNAMDKQGLTLMYWAVLYHGAREPSWWQQTDKRITPSPSFAEMATRIRSKGGEYGRIMLTSCRLDLSLGLEGAEENPRYRIPVTMNPFEYDEMHGGGNGSGGAGSAKKRKRQSSGSSSASDGNTSDDDLDTFEQEGGGGGGGMVSVNNGPPIMRHPYPLFAYVKDYIGLHLTKDKGCDCAGNCADNPNCKCKLRNLDNVNPYNADGTLKPSRSSICECGPACRCRGDCGLHRTRRSVGISVEVKWTGPKGWGVFTREDVKQNQYVMSYIGEYLTIQQAQDRVEKYEESNFNVNYQVEVHGAKPFVIDATYGGNVARLINHCCGPNLIMKKVTMFGVNYERAAFFATTDIPKGTELTFNYDPSKNTRGSRRVAESGQECLCGSDRCRKKM